MQIGAKNKQKSDEGSMKNAASAAKRYKKSPLLRGFLKESQAKNSLNLIN
jgi:hypothetical protein